nr:MAG TPA: hypothetical protein [Caudoviricetes sp.]
MNFKGRGATHFLSLATTFMLTFFGVPPKNN